LTRTTARRKKSRRRRTKGTVEDTGYAEPLTSSAANLPTAHMPARTSNLAEDVVVVGVGVEVGAGAVGERLRLALVCRTAVTTTATSYILGSSVDVAEDVGVVRARTLAWWSRRRASCARGAQPWVEPSSGCVGGSNQKSPPPATAAVDFGDLNV